MVLWIRPPTMFRVLIALPVFTIPLEAPAEIVATAHINFKIVVGLLIVEVDLAGGGIDSKDLCTGGTGSDNGARPA